MIPKKHPKICSNDEKLFKHSNICAHLQTKNEKIETIGIRKSKRERKIKEFVDNYVDPEKEFNSETSNLNSEENVTVGKKIKVKEEFKLKELKILSSMATKCPHCDFAADSDVQVMIVYSARPNIRFRFGFGHFQWIR